MAKLRFEPEDSALAEVINAVLDLPASEWPDGVDAANLKVIDVLKQWAKRIENRDAPAIAKDTPA